MLTVDVSIVVVAGVVVVVVVASGVVGVVVGVGVTGGGALYQSP